MGDAGPAPEDREEEAESDAEQAESEWHVWLLGMLVVGGIALILAPADIVPELIVGLGPLFVLLGIVGWIVQWVYERRSATIDR